MAKINLLPWRELHREEKKKEFVAIAAGCAVFGIAIVFFWIQMVNGQINIQKSRNRFLESRIVELDKEVVEIKQLRETRDDIIARMQVIQDLQGKRPVIVRIFDEMVRAVPDGLFISELNRTNDSIFLKGTAESNQRVSSFMRNLDNSEWFKEPNLTGVIANPEAGEEASNFELTVKIADPKADLNVEEEAA